MRHKITLPAAENGRYIFAVSFFKNPVSSLEQKRPGGAPFGTITNPVESIFVMIFYAFTKKPVWCPRFSIVSGADRSHESRVKNVCKFSVLKVPG